MAARVEKSLRVILEDMGRLTTLACRMRVVIDRARMAVEAYRNMDENGSVAFAGSRLEIDAMLDRAIGAADDAVRTT